MKTTIKRSHTILSSTPVWQTTMTVTTISSSTTTVKIMTKQCCRVGARQDSVFPAVLPVTMLIAS